MTDQQVAVLRLLSIEGIIEDSRLVDLLSARGLFKGGDEVRSVLSGLEAGGMVEALSPELWGISDSGKQAMSEYLQSRRKDMRPLLRDDVWPRFKELDSELKRVCTMWQVRPDGTPNHHEDPEYDFSVLETLNGVHERLGRLLGEDNSVEQEFRGLLSNLGAAVERINNGEFNYVVGTTVNSYHGLWREVHGDLLSTLGLPREE